MIFITCIITKVAKCTKVDHCQTIIINYKLLQFSKIFYKYYIIFLKIFTIPPETSCVLHVIKIK